VCKRERERERERERKRERERERELFDIVNVSSRATIDDGHRQGHWKSFCLSFFQTLENQQQNFSKVNA